MTFFLQICGRTLPYICKENVNKTGQKTARISFFFRHFSLEKSPIFAPKRTRFFGADYAPKLPRSLPFCTRSFARSPLRGIGGSSGGRTDLSRILPPVFCARISPANFEPGRIIVPEVAELHAGYYAHVLRPQIVRHGRLQAMCSIKPYGAF